MRILCLMVVCAVASVAVGGVVGDGDIIGRGDANDDGAVNVSDPSAISDWLFNGGNEPPCLNQADANNDGAVDVSDVSFLSTYLFLGGPQPPSPGPNATTCSVDDLPRPGCVSSSC